MRSRRPIGFILSSLGSPSMGGSLVKGTCVGLLLACCLSSPWRVERGKRQQVHVVGIGHFLETLRQEWGF